MAKYGCVESFFSERFLSREGVVSRNLFFNRILFTLKHWHTCMPQSHPAQLCTNPTGVKSCAPLRLSPSQAGNVRREDLLFPESYEEFCLTVTGMSKTESFFTSSFLELLPASRTMIHYQPARQSKLFYSFSKNIRVRLPFIYILNKQYLLTVLEWLVTPRRFCSTLSPHSPLILYTGVPLQTNEHWLILHLVSLDLNCFCFEHNIMPIMMPRPVAPVVFKPRGEPSRVGWN